MFSCVLNISLFTTYRIGKPVVERYGMSEAQIMTSSDERTALLNVGSVGRPLKDVQVCEDKRAQIEG